MRFGRQLKCPSVLRVAMNTLLPTRKAEYSSDSMLKARMGYEYEWLCQRHCLAGPDDRTLATLLRDGRRPPHMPQCAELPFRRPRPTFRDWTDSGPQIPLPREGLGAKPVGVHPRYARPKSRSSGHSVTVLGEAEWAIFFHLGGGCYSHAPRLRPSVPPEPFPGPETSPNACGHAPSGHRSGRREFFPLRFR